jgi:hypothetical protein
METGHPEGVVEKAVAYVKDLFGLETAGNELPQTEGASMRAEPVLAEPAPAEKDATRVDNPQEYTYQSVAELNARRARLEDGE